MDSSDALSSRRLALVAGTTATALLAVALPTLIAFNVAPSATFLNQAVAYVGWGGFLLILGAALVRGARPGSPAALALLAALAILALSALVAPLWASLPWPLSLSATGTVLSAMLVVAVGASVQRAGLAHVGFRAFCIALVAAGVASSVIGWIQVFAPELADGEWIALASPGRASGNLRQPNHLSSLLLWSVVAVAWLSEAKVWNRWVAAALALGFVYVVMLSGSRTGALGMLTLAGWGLLDRRLSRGMRLFLLLSPVVYAVSGWATGAWAAAGDQMVIGTSRLAPGGGDFTSARLAIWSNTLALIASHPWFGVGFGEFNLAWTLTPFPGRPTEFFDHAHNIVLHFLVELGVPLGLLVVGLFVYALWQALQHAIGEGRERPDAVPVQRAAFVIVFMVAVHSMLEYPLWYAYFLLPTAFAFGLCVERIDPALLARERDERPANVTRPFVLASLSLVVGATLALYDYMRVVVIFAPPAHAGPLGDRVAAGRRSILFAHHGDYAAATITDHPGTVIDAFAGASHYLLDARLMQAWATALHERGELDKARHVAARLKEFRHPQSAEFFAPCTAATLPSGHSSTAAASAPAATAALPFQCTAPTRPLTFEEFR